MAADEPEGTDPSDGGELPVDDETVVRTAAEAAETVVFEAYRSSAVKDLDVTVSFEDAVLEVDVYLSVPEDPDGAEAVVDEAALAGRRAVDELFEDAE